MVLFNKEDKDDEPFTLDTPPLLNISDWQEETENENESDYSSTSSIDTGEDSPYYDNNYLEFKLLVKSFTENMRDENVTNMVLPDIRYLYMESESYEDDEGFLHPLSDGFSLSTPPEKLDFDNQRSVPSTSLVSSNVSSSTNGLGTTFDVKTAFNRIRQLHYRNFPPQRIGLTTRNTGRYGIGLSEIEDNEINVELEEEYSSIEMDILIHRYLLFLAFYFIFLSIASR